MATGHAQKMPQEAIIDNSLQMSKTLDMLPSLASNQAHELGSRGSKWDWPIKAEMGPKSTIFAPSVAFADSHIGEPAHKNVPQNQMMV